MFITFLFQVWWCIYTQHFAYLFSLIIVVPNPLAQSRSPVLQNISFRELDPLTITETSLCPCSRDHVYSFQIYL